MNLEASSNSTKRSAEAGNHKVVNGRRTRLLCDDEALRLDFVECHWHKPFFQTPVHPSRPPADYSSLGGTGEADDD
jgi:hypothetical protein